MKVLIGIDGSRGSFAAVRLASRLLSPTEDRVALYYSPPDIRLSARRGASPEIVERARAALTESVLQEGRAQLPEAMRARLETIVGTKNPRQGMILAADAWRAELIVVGATGKGKAARLFLGGVAKSVVHTATVPVLVVRAIDDAPSPRPLRVLLAFDGSAASRRAAPFLERFTWPEGAEGRVMTVVTPFLAGEVPEWLEHRTRAPDAEVMAQAWVREHEEEKRRKHDELAELSRLLPRPFQTSDVIVTEGHSAETDLGYD